MSEFTERCKKAIKELNLLSLKGRDENTHCRLSGKIEGVKLALGYYNETEAAELAQLQAENAALVAKVAELESESHEDRKLIYVLADIHHIHMIKFGNKHHTGDFETCAESTCRHGRARGINAAALSSGEGA